MKRCFEKEREINVVVAAVEEAKNWVIPLTHKHELKRNRKYKLPSAEDVMDSMLFSSDRSSWESPICFSGFRDPLTFHLLSPPQDKTHRQDVVHSRWHAGDAPVPHQLGCDGPERQESHEASWMRWPGDGRHWVLGGLRCYSRKEDLRQVHPRLQRVLLPVYSGI